jgi:hypothetical protein
MRLGAISASAPVITGSGPRACEKKGRWTEIRFGLPRLVEAVAQMPQGVPVAGVVAHKVTKFEQSIVFDSECSM